MAEKRVWVVLSENSGAYAEAAETLRGGLAEWNPLIGPWAELAAAGEPPALVVTLGHAALDTSLRGLAEKAGSWERVPVLATLLPRSSYEATLAAGQVGRRPLSAVVLDMPLARQLALIKLALPERTRVGVLVGPLTRPLLAQLGQEAQARQLQLIATAPVASTEAVFPALKEALESADVLLALPEPSVYHSASLQNILLASYRARVPLVAFSAAYVKAGALLAVYATPAQVARQAAAVARGWLAGRYADGAPPVQSSREFSIVANPHVATALGIRLDEAERLAEALRRREGAP